VVKIGYRADLSREEVIDLVISALFEAADEDSATGGPDLVRAIYPSVATITANGFEAVEESEVAERFRGLVELLSATRGPHPGGKATT
jgi:proteasome beta subunit